MTTRPEPGAHIHQVDPFAVPDSDRSPIRRLRGRLPAAVTIWTATAADGRPAGLTISSTMIADGEPGRVLGLIDPESELYATAEAAGRFAVIPLDAGQQRLADIFAGIVPSPGGPFRDWQWVETGYGPVLAGQDCWVGCRVECTRALGWGMLVEATVERLVLGDRRDPLVYFRGRYRRLADTR